MCSICGFGSEDTLHAIRDCIQARAIWVRFIPLHLVGSFFSTELREWLDNNLSFRQSSGRGAAWPEVMAMICWSIWKWRNREVFSHETLPLEMKICQIVSNVRELELVWGLDEYQYNIPESTSVEGDLGNMYM